MAPFRPDRLDQLVLLHLAAPRQLHVAGDVAQLGGGPVLKAAVRIARSLGGLVGGAALLAAALVDRAGGDLLGLLLGDAALLGALLDVLVLALVLVAPCSRHDWISFPQRRGPVAGPPPRSRTDGRADGPDRCGEEAGRRRCRPARRSRSSPPAGRDGHGRGRPRCSGSG